MTSQYKTYPFLTFCPICGKKYDRHWKVVNHIRKTKDQEHQNFLLNEENKLLAFYLKTTKNIHEKLYLEKNIFAGISYEKIMLAIGKYLVPNEIDYIRKGKISSTLMSVPKSIEHNQKVSKSVKKAWEDGKFDTKEYKEAVRLGYENGKDTSGKNNHMYGKPAPKGSGTGKGGIRKDIGHYVRSAWEANICRIIKYIGREYQYEPTRFFLNIDGKDCSYCPDIYFPAKNLYYEIKGHAKSSRHWICTCSSCIKNRKKILQVREKYGIKIILIGLEEYKKFRRRFKKVIIKWEK